MLPKKAKVIFLAITVVILSVKISPVMSSVSSCSASVSPATIVTGASSDLTFKINNTSSSSIVWVKMTAPSGNFVTVSGNASGWAFSLPSATTIVFTGATLGTQAAADFTVRVTTGSSEVSSASFTVEASDDSGGASPTSCTGSTGVAISGSPPDTSSPQVSDVVVSDISDSSAKVNWTTSESANSTVDYGTTASYGSSKSDSTLSTSHSITLDSLSANTTYHFRISTTDSSGNNETTEDLDFVTAKAGTTVTKTETKTVTKETTTTKTVKDTVLPTVRLITDFKKPYETAPAISGIASDDSGISKVEYTIDNGENWLPVDSINSLFAKSTAFEFTPPVTDDGDYKLKVRSFDPTGNVAASRVYVLTIDRLPPLVGASLFSAGPIILKSDSGVVALLAGLSHKITLSNIGGANTVKLLIGGETNLEADLVKNLENGLWFGNLVFDRAGIYTVKAISEDGAKNKTERELTSVLVQEGGIVKDSAGSPIAGVRISLYYFEPIIKEFVLWDGAAFGQQNPQKTGESGRFSLLAPAGKYFFELSHPDFALARSQIFNLDWATAINGTYQLQGKKTISIGSLKFPFFNFTANELEVDFEKPGFQGGVTSQDLQDMEFPVIDLFKGRETVSTLTLRGRPTVVTVLTGWLPGTSAQLNALAETAKNTEISVMPIFSQEKASAADSFAKRLRLNLPVYADADGFLTEVLKVNSLPAHFFLNRKGIIKSVKYGVLNEEELVNNVVN